MKKQELSDKSAFLWTLFGIMLLLFVFQQLGNQVQWYLNMAGLVLANEIFAFLVSDKDTVKNLSSVILEKTVDKVMVDYNSLMPTEARYNQSIDYFNKVYYIDDYTRKGK